MNYSGAALEKPKTAEFDPVRSWCTEHCPVAHRTLSGGTPDSPFRQTRAHLVPLIFYWFVLNLYAPVEYTI
jgi:hypothetical protein